MPATASLPADPVPPSNYLDLYGLSKPPFGGAPDGASYILFGSHRRTFEILIDHMVNGSGIVVLYGEEGVGKTEMLRAACDVAVDAGSPVIRVSRPPNGRVDLPQLVSALLGRRVADETIDDSIRGFLAPPRKALLADDIDLMPADCVRVLARLVEQMPTDPGGPAIVLSSTTDLAADPNRPDLSQLVRLARNTIRISRLGPAEARQYIERSLWVAGGTTRRLITPDALKLLIARSGGVLGSINHLMEAAFTAGFARGDSTITAKTVAATTGPTTSRPHRRTTSHQDGVAARAMQIVAFGLLVGGASMFLYKALNTPSDRLPLAQHKPVTSPMLAPSPPPVALSASELPPPAKPAETLSADVVAALMKRGDQSLGLGDTAAARLLFRRAAEAGNAAAATALGRTYDPNYVSAGTAPGDRPDPAQAAEWYKKAVTLGDPRAAELLKRLGRP
ncbi:MAG: hypothetical protein P4L90_02300 [Rhodopila sp.]|nr:hypothetical protein [Rhodopila sp.]